MSALGKNKALEIKHEGVHELVVIRLRLGKHPEWSADTFHGIIYKRNIGRWLRNRKDTGPLERIVCKHAMFTTTVFPSVRIEAGKRGAKAQKGFKTDIETTSASGGHVFTMASPVWLILYLLSPNCAQGKARVKQRIAERSFAMLQVLAKIAYKGHAAGSASASISGDLKSVFTLKTCQGSADVCVDGELRMDGQLTAWRNSWSEKEALGNVVKRMDPKKTLWRGFCGYGAACSCSTHLAKSPLHPACLAVPGTL